MDMNAYMGDALDEQGVDLLLQMLRYNPDERISVCNLIFISSMPGTVYKSCREKFLHTEVCRRRKR